MHACNSPRSQSAAMPVAASAVPLPMKTAPAARLPAARPRLIAFLPGRLRGLEGSTPCSLPKATAELQRREGQRRKGGTAGSGGEVNSAAAGAAGLGSACRGSLPCCCINVLAELVSTHPVRVMAPMRVPRKVAVMCTPSRWAGSAPESGRRGGKERAEARFKRIGARGPPSRLPRPLPGSLRRQSRSAGAAEAVLTRSHVAGDAGAHGGQAHE